ncbi:hypothetical protein Q9R19_01135 [Microbacterium sp. ARD32]|uniref:hypothetical protein n=1 Tax=Microbacterium sp. ARD32 TaxID=2962577 RepID=UPI00288138F9|nr:hypothetical protein [Microbacterium sp. ARD32]MDT0156220.1 hypothetical protein [Microbacterium sp. ARD32]
MHTTRIRRSRLALAAAGAATLLTLTACSAASTASDSAPSSTAAPQDAQGARQPSGVSGVIAAAQDGQLQVQTSDAQTTVRYTSETAVRTTVSGTVADLQLGECVLAVGGDDEAATRITVTESVDGECAMAGMPGGGAPGGAAPGAGGGTPPEGERPEGMPTGAPGEIPAERPEGMPTDRPDGGSGEGAQGGFPGGGITIGKVTAVTAEAVSIDALAPDDDEAGATTSTELSVNADTTVSRTAEGTTDDIAQGLCVSAQGEADDAGGYDATSLTLSQPGDDGTCSRGRGGFGGPPSSGDGQGGDGDD